MDIIFYILGIVIFLLIWYKPLKRNINSYRFWMLLQSSGGKATEYLRNSPHWKIEATNEGILKDWFGPYRLNSFGFTFYVYCKTDNVSAYMDDFKFGIQNKDGSGRLLSGNRNKSRRKLTLS